MTSSGPPIRSRPVFAQRTIQPLPPFSFALSRTSVPTRTGPSPRDRSRPRPTRFGSRRPSRFDAEPQPPPRRPVGLARDGAAGHAEGRRGSSRLGRPLFRQCVIRHPNMCPRRHCPGAPAGVHTSMGSGLPIPPTTPDFGPKTRDPRLPTDDLWTMGQPGRRPPRPDRPLTWTRCGSSAAGAAGAG